jgi:hypothetical protein
MWPPTPAALVRAQLELAALSPPPWRPSGGHPLVAGCYVCFGRGEVGRGRAHERGWAAAVLMRGNRRLVESAVAVGAAGAPYEPGLLALREGPLLEAALRMLPDTPEVLLANATGRDHPRAAGLALHLGAMLDQPSIGVTDRRSRPRARNQGLILVRRVPCCFRGSRSHACFERGPARARSWSTRAGGPTSTLRLPWCTPRHGVPGPPSRSDVRDNSLATRGRRGEAAPALKTARRS